LSQTALQARLKEFSFLQDAGVASQLGADRTVRVAHPHLPPNHLRGLAHRQGDEDTEYHYE
jgi:hypothetical protein